MQIVSFSRRVGFDIPRKVSPTNCPKGLCRARLLHIDILAHQRYAQDELKWSLFVRRPSLR